MLFWTLTRDALYRWRRFFHPIPGWKLRYRQYKAGQTVWAVPGKEDADPVCPWPVQWIPVRLDPSLERGFEFLESECSESYRPLPIGVGVCCVRCGIHLHPDRANVVGHFDPPRCSRCAPLVALAH